VGIIVGPYCPRKGDEWGITVGPYCPIEKETSGE